MNQSLEELINSAEAVADHLVDVLANHPLVAAWPDGKPNPPTIQRLRASIRQVRSELR